MQVSRTFLGKQEAIYATLLQSLQADYKEVTGELLDVTAIAAGLTYQKTFGKQKENSMLVQVRQLIAPSLYEVAISSNRGLQVISYQIEQVDEQQVTLTYSEEYFPETKWQAWNYKCLYPFLKNSLQKRMTFQLQQLIHIVNNKEVQ